MKGVTKELLTSHNFSVAFFVCFLILILLGIVSWISGDRIKKHCPKVFAKKFKKMAPASYYYSPVQ